jgi:DNA-binding MarR family transcriptional regulator
MAGKLQHEIRKTNPFDNLEEEAHLNLLRTADALQQGFVDLLKPHQLSPTQYNVLRILRGAAGDGLACRDIGERLITRDPDITRLLDRLEQRGFIARQRQTSDRRVVKASITADGLKLLASLDEPVLKIQKKQLGHLPAEKLRALIELLELARTRPTEHASA